MFKKNLAYVLLTVLVIMVSSCGSSSVGGGIDLSVSGGSLDNDTNENLNNNALDILNQIRSSAGLNKLAFNSKLAFASKKHSQYLDTNNISGHIETREYSNFYETTPSKRAFKAGYLSNVLENVSTGDDNVNKSIVSLMSAIYHRFGFLDFKINEIGYGYTGSSYVYNMGNSHINNLCSGHSFNGTGTYIYSVCKNEDLKIEESVYNKTNNITINKNPPYVLSPSHNDINIDPVFYEESPDPLPSYSVSGYPVSIQFNPSKIDPSTLSLNSFTLKDNNNNLVPYITIMNKQNDPNNKFTNLQFALFPKSRLEYNSMYHARINYSQNEKNKTINWSFKTKKPPGILHRITHTQKIYIKSNTKYALYTVPRNSNDTQGRINYSYLGLKVIKDYFIDSNTYLIQVLGKKGDYIILTFNEDIKVTLIIQ